MEATWAFRARSAQASHSKHTGLLGTRASRSEFLSHERERERPVPATRGTSYGRLERGRPRPRRAHAHPYDPSSLNVNVNTDAPQDQVRSQSLPDASFRHSGPT